MQTLLFFDDWFLSWHQGLRRIWKQPRPIGEPYSDPYAEEGAAPTSVEYHGGSGQWRAWNNLVRNPIGRGQPLRQGVGNHLMLLWVSDDGVHWRPYDRGIHNDNVPEEWPHVLFSQAVSGGGQVYCDAREDDPERRYKSVTVLCTGRDPVHGVLGYTTETRIITSRDGVSWKVADLVHALGSDSYHSFSYNPSSERYQLLLRASSPDRRIFMSRSVDTRTWEKPFLVLGPDASDPQCAQFYAMPHFQYHGYYIGMLWVFHTQYDERTRRKGEGRIETQLTYSLNGISWNRQRQPFVPMGEPGEAGEGCVYGCSLVEHPGGDLWVYALLSPFTHARVGRNALAAYTLRRDGFVCLAPDGGWGVLTTCAIELASSRLTVNGRAPRGQIRVEVLNADEQPIEEYSGEGAAVFSGDETDWEVKWPNASLSQLQGKQIKLRLHLTHAELYAIRFEGVFAYSDHVHYNLEGTEYGVSALPPREYSAMQ